MRRGRHLVIVQQVDRFVGVSRIVERVGCRCSVFEAGADIGDLLCDFGLGEAELHCPAVFRGGRIETPTPLAVAGVDRQAGGAHRLEQVLGREVRVAERGVVAVGQAFQPPVDDAVADLSQQLELAVGDRVGLIEPRAVDRDGHAFGQRGIDIDLGQAFAGEVDRPSLGFGLRRGRFPVAEMLPDLGFDQRRIEVPDYDQGHVAGRVSAAPERLEVLRVRGVERFGGADRKACGELRLRVKELPGIVEVAVRERVAHALFRQHHPALPVDRALVEAQFARSLAHQHQRRIEQVGVVARQVELIQREVETGRRVGIGPERQPLALEQLDHLAFGHVGRAVKRHVLDEMGVALLGIGFRNRPGIHVEPHLCLRLRGGVWANDVAHPVRELAELERRIDRQVALLPGPVGLRDRVGGGSLGEQRRLRRGEREGEQCGARGQSLEAKSHRSPVPLRRQGPSQVRRGR